MSKHTPGPWFVWEPETRTGSGSDEYATGIVIGRNRPDMTQEIATINCESIFFKDTELLPVKSDLLREECWPKAPIEAIANAKLIAAAPSLLKALKQILADWESVNPDASVPDEINNDAHWNAVRSAIRKAQGADAAQAAKD